MRKLYCLLIALMAAIVFFACSKENNNTPADPCAGVTVALTGTVTNATAGASNGSINVAATGGSGFTYSINSGAFNAASSFTGLAPGTYTVTAKNSAGCTGSAQFTVSAVNPCAGVNIVISGTVTGTITGQSNGSIQVTATGGSGFTYSLNNGPFQASGNFTNLAAGNYTVVAKNSDGCTGSQQFTVAAINPCAGVNVVVTGTVVNASSGQNNGSITASATGGSGFTYSLNNGAFQSSGTFSNLAAATYTVTAKNSDGCTGSQQFTVGTINPCSGVNIVITTNSTAAVPCGGPAGSVSVLASGSTGFMYSINSGAFQSSNIFNNLQPGNYGIVVRDANNCNANASVTVATAQAGPLFTEVRNIIQANCVGCHNPSNPSGGMNWTVDCNIVSNRLSIKARAVDQAGTSTQMPPPPGALSAAERQKILDWVNAGGQYNQ